LNWAIKLNTIFIKQIFKYENDVAVNMHTEKISFSFIWYIEKIAFMYVKFSSSIQLVGGGIALDVIDKKVDYGE